MKLVNLDKIIVDDVVYISAYDAAEKLSQQKGCDKTLEEIQKLLYDKSSLTWNGMLLIKESDFNDVIRKDEQLLNANCGYEEITRVRTLKQNIESIISVAPIMKLYQSEEKVLEYVEQQIEESKNKLLEELTEKQRDYYRESVELLEDKSFIDVNKIKSLGLEIQLLTTYTPSRSVPCDLKCFIAGDGIFFEVVLDRTSEDLYSDIDMSEKGLVVPYLNFNYDIIKQEYPTVVMRDFRAHSAIENLAWCAYHAELNDSDGLIEVDDGAVHFFIEYEVFLNLYTMFAKPKVHFIDGIIETDSEII